MEFQSTPMMSFIDAVKTCITKKYCTFKGRARRSEYWWFSLLYSIILSIPTYALQYLIFWKLGQKDMLEKQVFEAALDSDKMAALTAQAEAVDATFGTYMPIIVIVLAVVWLGLLLPAWGVLVRRLHDIGKSGWAMLIVLIPIIGAFVLLYWLLKDSDKAANKYGESPKYISVEV